MPASTIVCGTCSGAVPAGRFSCPSCGELLASVVGGRAPAASAADRPPAPGPAATAAEDASPPASTSSAPIPAILYDPADAPTASVLDGDVTLAEMAPLWPDDPGSGDDDRIPDAAPTADPAPRPSSADLAAASFAGPGAYVPPSTPIAERPAPPPPPIQPAGPAAPARAWAGTAGSHAVALEGSVPAQEAPASPVIDGARVTEFVGWLAVAGGALASVGFLLPWSHAAVIGARGVGYFDRWGLAGPFHVVVVLGLLAVVALSIVRTPVPVWARVGVAGGALAALLIGLAWPYLLGPLGAGPGVLCVALGAVLLGVASVVAIAADRRTGSSPGV